METRPLKLQETESADTEQIDLKEKDIYMKHWLFGFAVIMAAICFYFYSKFAYLDKTLQNQKIQIQAIESKLSNKGNVDLIDLQEKCSNQAQKQFDSLGWKKGGVYVSHYNAKLNKCFLIAETSDTGQNGNIFQYILLIDAYEGQLYGDYMWMSDKVKKYWEVPPKKCKVALPTGEEKPCNSREELLAMTNVYMESAALK
jgi:hypothetical protein